jgi:hypothetical protein
MNTGFAACAGGGGTEWMRGSGQRETGQEDCRTVRRAVVIGIRGRGEAGRRGGGGWRGWQSGGAGGLWGCLGARGLRCGEVVRRGGVAGGASRGRRCVIVGVGGAVCVRVVGVAGGDSLDVRRRLGSRTSDRAERRRVRDLRHSASACTSTGPAPRTRRARWAPDFATAIGARWHHDDFRHGGDRASGSA